MPSYIIKIDTPAGPRYLEYSTIVDAPVTFGMTLQEFRKYYRRKYGRSEYESGLPRRMARVERYGTSAMDYKSAEETVKVNRAGKGETDLTFKQIVKFYGDAANAGKDPPRGTE